MNRRSRSGCIDCRRSKVKCDEIRPSCGTCARRRRVCQGYTNCTQKHPRAKSVLSAQPERQNKERRSSSSNITSESTTSPGHPSNGRNELSAASSTIAASSSTTALGCRRPCSELSLRGMPLIPPGMISPADEPTIEVYFNRHPFEMVMGSEFVSEMNANVLVVLQHNPKAVSDSLSGIGQVYLSRGQSNSAVTVLDRRARILANLRAMKNSSYDLEYGVVLLLGLSAMEVIYPQLDCDKSDRASAH